MKSQNIFQKPPSITIRWTEKYGFVSKSHRQKFKDQDLRLIEKFALPTGSDWRRYYGLRSLRFWTEQLESGKFFVFSIAYINKIETSKGTTKFAPEAKVYLLRESDLDDIKSQSAYDVIKKINIINKQNIWDKTGKYNSINLRIEGRFYTIKNNAIMKLNDAWIALETAFINKLIITWPNQICTFSTFCTPQDDTSAFEIIGYLEDDLKAIPIREYSTIVIDSTLNIILQKHSRIEYLISTLKSWPFRRSYFSYSMIVILVILSFFLGLILANK